MTNQLTMIKTPLASLVKDPQNVRSRDYAEEDVRQLADMIASKGLLQPPLVRQMKGGKKPVFGVSAGGRRLARPRLAHDVGGGHLRRLLQCTAWVARRRSCSAQRDQRVGLQD